MDQQKKHKFLIDRWDVKIFVVFGYVQWFQLSEKFVDQVGEHWCS